MLGYFRREAGRAKEASTQTFQSFVRLTHQSPFMLLTK